MKSTHLYSRFSDHSYDPKTSVLSEHFPACREGLDERNTDAVALL